jgi:thymidylate synthase
MKMRNNDAESQYLEILKDILDNGISRTDRTGIGTLSVFGRSIRHSYSNGFPLLTTKKMFIKGILGELLWFIKGTDDARFLIDNNIHIWDEWMKEDGSGNKTLPHTYGVKWRNFDGIDQLQNVINDIKNNPYSRRHVVSAWDPRHIKDAALPWCHVLFQFHCIKDEDKNHDKNYNDGRFGDLSLTVYQRSGDFFLGAPFNITSYSFLLYMICEITNYRPGEMYYTFGDCHIYKNHFEQVKEQLSRIPYTLPQLEVKHKENINDFTFDDFKITNYTSHPTIKAEVAV